ncbi:MAG: sigma 54-interacting transcriptional regulator [Rhizobacter sp.]|nr:sigma 54-interacting transcriptional regulator [Chlorobiales bacterium]
MKKTEAELQQFQLTLGNALAGTLTWEGLCAVLASELNPFVPHDVLALLLITDTGQTRTLAGMSKGEGGGFAVVDEELREKRSGIDALELDRMRIDILDASRIKNLYTPADFETLASQYAFAKLSKERLGIQAAIYFPVRISGTATVVLAISSRNPDGFTGESLPFVESLVPPFTIAAKNQFAIEELRRRDSEKTLLLNLNNAIINIKEREALAFAVAAEIDKVIRFDTMSLNVQTEEQPSPAFFVMTGGSTGTRLSPPLVNLTLSKSPEGIFTSITDEARRIPQIEGLFMAAYPPPQTAGVYNGKDFADLCDRVEVQRIARDGFGIRSVLIMPLQITDGPWSVLLLGSKTENAFTPDDLSLIVSLSVQISLALENLAAFEARQRREQEKALILSISNALTNIKDRDTLGCMVATKINEILPLELLVMTTEIIPVNYSSTTAGDAAASESATPSQTSPYLQQLGVVCIKSAEGKFESSLQALTAQMSDVQTLFLKALPPPYPPTYLGTKAYNEMAERFEAFRLGRDMIGVKSAIIVPLRFRSGLAGVLTLNTTEPDAYTESDLNFITVLATQIVLAVENLSAYEQAVRREAEKTLLLSFSNAVINIKDRQSLSRMMAAEINKIIPHDFFSLTVHAPLIQKNLSPDSFIQVPVNLPPVAGRTPLQILISVLRKTSEGKFTSISGDIQERVPPTRANLDAFMASPAEPAIYSGEAFDKICEQSPLFKDARDKYGLRSAIQVAVRLSDELFGRIVLCSEQSDVFTEIDLSLLESLAAQISFALENLAAFERIESLQSQIRQENTLLTEEIKTNINFDEIIGTSKQVLDVFKKIGQVAPMDSTVLIQGETGTGKELIARAIHNLSPRKDKPLIKINCAALPPSLVESELFGHEKGSFTGAHERRLGKFELAHKGTIFLDEIGELPLEMQSKLLRVLQEKEIERIGGKTTITVDVRIIAATNRDLEKEVAEKRFRSDLFYRLNVFPITVPPLRERREDILRLARHFVLKLAKRLGKPVVPISDAAAKEMLAYNWPGNVREMEHVIELSLITSSGNALELGKSLVAFEAAVSDRSAEQSIQAMQSISSIISLPPADGVVDAPSSTDIQRPATANSQTGSDSQPAGSAVSPRPIKTLEESERDHILMALRQSNGRIRGTGGASELLGIKPSTLEARMKKLGIKRKHTSE